MITVVIINMCNYCNYRYVMSWTPEQSSLLSALLDEVGGHTGDDPHQTGFLSTG